jgi:hypothetical protein
VEVCGLVATNSTLPDRSYRPFLFVATICFESLVAEWFGDESSASLTRTDKPDVKGNDFTALPQSTIGSARYPSLS